MTPKCRTTSPARRTYGVMAARSFIGCARHILRPATKMRARVVISSIVDEIDARAAALARKHVPFIKTTCVHRELGDLLL